MNNAQDEMVAATDRAIAEKRAELEAAIRTWNAAADEIRKLSTDLEHLHADRRRILRGE